MIFALVLLAGLQAPDPSAQAAQAMRERRFLAAEQIYRELIQIEPREPRLHMNLGLALHSQGKFQQAIPEFAIYLKAFPQPGPIHLLTGLSHLKLNQPCDAIAPLEKARQWRANRQVFTELGDAYSGCKQYLNAAQAYQQAAKAGPDDPALTRAAARAWWQVRDYAKARPLFAAVESRFSSEPDFAYEYGDTLARAGGAAEGLPYLERAVKLAPTMTPARGALGRALVELNRMPEAIPHLEAAAPDDPTFLLPLSRAYRAVGRAQDAARAQAEYRAKVGSQD